jgi:glycosyltransferase involved in cell wall biosynthesis
LNGAGDRGDPRRGLRRRASLVVDLLRAEGAAAVADRALDHWAEGRRRRQFEAEDLAKLPAVPVLGVTAAPPVPWLGGVPAQLGVRMREEERLGDTALLYPECGGQRLEVVAAGRRVATDLSGTATFDPDHAALALSGEPYDGQKPLGEEGGTEAASWTALVMRAADVVRARLVHVEGAAGLPLDGLVALARRRPLVLALHDFALCCPRANLYDESRGASCGCCADAATCQATLAASGHPGAAYALRWRERGAELVAACRCVIYPSQFLLDAHLRLFGNAGADARVIAPGIEGARMEPWRWPWTPRSAAPTIAFLGGGAAHKGSLLLAAVIREWLRRGLQPLRWQVLGGGRPEQLRALRKMPGVRVRGYYRHGSLGGLLRARRVELALLLPQVPESFSLILSECLAAGVPVMALAQGALAERLAASGGHLLPEGAGAGEIVAALQEWVVGGLAVPAPPPPMPSSRDAAAAFARLYDELSRHEPPATE